MTKDFTKPRTLDDHHRLTNRKPLGHIDITDRLTEKPIRPVYTTNTLTETNFDTQVTHTTTTRGANASKRTKVRRHLDLI